MAGGVLATLDFLEATLGLVTRQCQGFSMEYCRLTKIIQGSLEYGRWRLVQGILRKARWSKVGRLMLGHNERSTQIRLKIG